MPNPPLQIYPQGLLGFLQQKAGRNPGPLTEGLLPSLELATWYLETNTESLFSINNVLALGNVSFTELTVPQGEWWYVSGFDVGTATLGAGDVVQYRGLAIQPGGGTQAITELSNRATVGLQCSLGPMMRPVWIGPGGGLFIKVVEFTGAEMCNASAIITRLPN